MPSTIDKAAFSRELSETMASRGITRAELARRMGTDRATVGRVLDPAETRVTLDTLARAAAVLGRIPVVALTPERPSALLARRRDALRRIAEARGLRNVRIFGSVARGDDTPESDLDLVADLPAELSLLAVAAIAEELSEALGRHVDLAERGALERHVKAEIDREGVPL